MSKLILFSAVVVLLTGCSHEDKDIHNLQSQNDAQLAQIQQLEYQLEYINKVLRGLDGSLQLNSAQIAELQVTVQGLTVQLATLQGYKGIVEVLDPCGDAAGKVDEVLLRLSDGSLLASFSDNASGANTRFSVLVAGSYSTTDGTNCAFTVHANSQVTW